MAVRQGAHEGLSKVSERAMVLTTTIALAVGGCATHDAYPPTETRRATTTSLPIPTIASVSVRPGKTTTPEVQPGVWNYPVCEGVFVNLKDGWALVRPVSEAVPNSDLYFPKFVHIRDDGASPFDAAPLYPKSATAYQWLDMNGENLGEKPPANCLSQPMHVVKVNPMNQDSCKEVIGSTRLKEGTAVELGSAAALKNQTDIYSQQITFTPNMPGNESLSQIAQSLLATPFNNK